MIKNWRHWLGKVKRTFNEPQDGKVVYDHYVRTGNCNQCGKCCSEIYLIHEDQVIDSVEKFDKLKDRHPDYEHFEPMAETANGVMFQCRNLQPDNTCGIYDDRPTFCKKYPSEATMLHGGNLAPGCGYLLTARFPFQDVLDKLSTDKKLTQPWRRPPGILLNDV